MNVTTAITTVIIAIATFGVANKKDFKKGKDFVLIIDRKVL